MSLMDLNLLPSGAKFQAAKIKLQKRVTKLVIIISLVWLGGVLIIFSLILIAKLRTTGVQAGFDKAQKAYLALTNNIIISQRLKYRAKIVGEVLNKRFEYAKAFEAINVFFPTEVTMTNFNTKSQGKFQLMASTGDGRSLDLVEMKIAEINKGLDVKFKKAEMTTLSYSGGIWTFTVEVDLK